MWRFVLIKQLKKKATAATVAAVAGGANEPGQYSADSCLPKTISLSQMLQ